MGQSKAISKNKQAVQDIFHENQRCPLMVINGKLMVISIVRIFCVLIYSLKSPQQNIFNDFIVWLCCLLHINLLYTSDMRMIEVADFYILRNKTKKHFSLFVEDAHF